MPSEGPRILPLPTLLLSLSFLSPCILAQIDPSSVLDARANDAPLPGGPLVDTAYLPAQIGGIVGAYAVSLVLVAIALLGLSKRRRDHLSAGNDEIDFQPVCKEVPGPGPIQSLDQALNQPLNLVTSGPTIDNTLPTYEASPNSGYILPSPTSTLGAPGVSPLVDQRIVASDRVMAQSQLEDMYRHVLEHEDAKKRGVAYDIPIPDTAHQPRASASVTSLKSPASTLTKKERSKPAGLNLSEERPQSRASSLLSALRSPRKKSSMKGVSISSPMMTPQSATFPRHHESQEMNAIPPRQYAPAPPPPVPTDQTPFGAVYTKPTAPAVAPDASPESAQSIDERIGFQLPSISQSHNRTTSQAPTEYDPESATSERSQSALVGLPSTPRLGGRFPTLPASPKPGQSFSRPNPPSAVRTGGSLPLRAYEPAMNSPSVVAHTTKQTVFERKGPLSPGGGMTPFTATAVPYSPYQPFTPCVPMTPSLVTKEDRKRMRKMVPKTPTLAMVKSEDEIW